MRASSKACAAPRVDTSCGGPHREIRLSEIIRLIDGPLAPFGDADQLRTLIDRDAEHRALYQVFLDVRDAAAKILEHTTLADIMDGEGANAGKVRQAAQEEWRRAEPFAHGRPRNREPRKR